MITIARYSLAIEAHVARAKLESEGIPAFVADEHTITADSLYSNAMGGVRLQVPEACVEQARTILATDFSEDLIAEQGHEAPKANTKKPLKWRYVILIAIAVGAVGKWIVGVGPASHRPASLAEQARAEVEKINAKAPIQLDEVTVLTKATFTDDYVIVLNMTLLDFETYEKEMDFTALRASVVEQQCAGQEGENSPLSMGLTLRLVYSAESGRLLNRFEIDRQDCR
ncbi:DUF2007 domain-containing protein [Pseudomonas solani]|uniref:putative signal transducing protein n=1 Tax=Pseudomonas solani TaxID=2731552 RepID=UPI003C3050AA